MGMFDYYLPDPDLSCPNCSLILEDWQGKDSACGLFVWKQGFAYPIEQKCFDLNIEDDKRKKLRLPKDFNIYTSCEYCENTWIDAICKTENEIWNETLITKIEKISKP